MRLCSSLSLEGSRPGGITPGLKATCHCETSTLQLRLDMIEHTDRTPTPQDILCSCTASPQAAKAHHLVVLQSRSIAELVNRLQFDAVHGSVRDKQYRKYSTIQCSTMQAYREPIRDISVQNHFADWAQRELVLLQTRRTLESAVPCE